MRYLKASIICGVIAAVLVAGLYHAGFFQKLDNALWQFLAWRPELPVSNLFAHYGVILLFSFGIAWTTIDINKILLKFIIVAVALFQVIASIWVLQLYGYYFSPFPALVAILAAFCFAFLYSRSEGGRRKKIARQVFGDRLSAKSFQSLVNSGQSLGLEGEMKEATILVCEIFNHDQLMTALDARDYVAMTNLFLMSGSDFLVEQGCYLDECDGESLRVIFGVPLENKKHATAACHAALELVKRFDAVNKQSEEKWKQKFDYRIGVNSGEVVAATYGSERLVTYSVAGEAVEFARRLCCANLLYGSRILLGSQTFNEVMQEIEARPMDLIEHQGDQVEVYELLAEKSGLSGEDMLRRDLFWKGVIYYREREWEQALEHFESARSFNGSDDPVEFYINRIADQKSGNPLTPEWNELKF